MNFTDTHIHLYADDYKPDLSAVLNRAKMQGVTKYFMPNIDLKSIENMLAITKEYPDICLPMLGLHPSCVDENWRQILDTMETWLDVHKWIAIGEIGIDLYHHTTFRSEQLAALERQLQWAKKYNLPISFHVRKGLDEVLFVLKKFSTHRFRGVFHCFGGSLADVQKIQEVGDFKFGIGGVVTFKNASLAAIIPEIGLENIVLETDGPYLAPVPFRGTRNEPAYILDIALKIADILGLSLPEIQTQTQLNIQSIFHQ